MKYVAVLLSLCLGALTSPALAAPGAKPVLELFSSQGCGNCPKANEEFGQFAARDDLIALTFAVGYWDYLGWADTFAKPEFTERQKAYNETLRRRGPYTPQLVMNGVDHCSGAKPRTVEKKLKALDEPSGDVAVVYDGRAAKISGATASPMDVWLVVYRPGDTLAIPEGGSNEGVEMRHHNLVTDLKALGRWSGGEMMIDAPCADACVVLVQSPGPGEIAGAAQYEPIGLTASN